MEKFEDKTYLSLVIRDFGSTIKDLNGKIGFSPTEAYEVGDVKIMGNNQIKIKHKYWQLKSNLPTSASINDHVIQLLNQIKPFESNIAEIAKDSKVTLSFAIYYEDNQPGISLPATIIKKIGKLNADIEFDMYFVGKK